MHFFVLFLRGQKGYIAITFLTFLVELHKIQIYYLRIIIIINKYDNKTTDNVTIIDESLEVDNTLRLRGDEHTQLFIISYVQI